MPNKRGSSVNGSRPALAEAGAIEVQSFILRVRRRLVMGVCLDPAVAFAGSKLTLNFLAV
jgi:hypothetical protein